MGEGPETSGRFVVFEGIDGSGLSTQATELSHYLRDSLNVPVHVTKEPTDGPAGSQIRMALRGRLAMNEAALALLFAADRLDHLETDVLPRLAGGVHVISDRYCLSSLAYQSLTQELSWLRAINTHCRRPDLTFFLDVPVEICMMRLRSQRWRLELYETEEKLVKVRQNYLRLIAELQHSGENIVVIPGVIAGQERSISAVSGDVQAAFCRLLSESP